MDEAGYTTGDWDSKENIEGQPFYVVGAVSIPIDNYKTGVEKLRSGIRELNLPGADKPLGLGFEIKAKDIAVGSEYWTSHNDERNKVRDLMLSFPKENGGCAFVVAINKQAHSERYKKPQNPYTLSLKFILERIQHHLMRIKEEGVIIYDLNHRLEPKLSSTFTSLMRNGSKILTYDMLGFPREYMLKIDRVLEFAFARSENSVCLIVADFFATMSYHYHKKGKPSSCRWWDLLREFLDKSEDGRLEGFGYKIFP